LLLYRGRFFKIFFKNIFYFFGPILKTFRIPSKWPKKK
jgi:hypothetical protein